MIFNSDKKLFMTKKKVTLNYYAWIIIVHDHAFLMYFKSFNILKKSIDYSNTCYNAFKSILNILYSMNSF